MNAYVLQVSKYIYNHSTNELYLIITISLSHIYMHSKRILVPTKVTPFGIKFSLEDWEIGKEEMPEENDD